MTQNKDSKLNIENKRKHRISLKRSRSVVSMNSNISDRMSTSPLIRQISFKKRRADIETKSFKSNYDEPNRIRDGNLTSLNVHDSKGNIVRDNEAPSNKADISHLHFGVDCESNSSINASSNLTIDLSKNNFIPSARPPKTPSMKSPVLDDWDSYNFMPSGSSNAESCLSANSIPNSISDSISSIVKRIPKGIRSGKSTNSSSLLDSSHTESYDKEVFIVDDVVHARRNRLQVKLNKVITHSNKRWLNIFQKRTQAENDQEITQPISPLDSPEYHEKFKSPAKVHHNSEIQKKPPVQSLIKCDSNIVPQKIIISNTKEIHTNQLLDSRPTYNKPDMHYVKRVTKQSRITNAAERSKDETYLVRKEQIFSPNTDLKDSANSPNYPEHIQGFSSLSIKDFLQDANSTN
ncbi:unnamed protein product [Debaryomyces tyrocola]|nr:unnamed protein product [Debaryomyces tyrocola]